MRRSRTALIHYWLLGMRGGERVLESLCRMYPDADIYTHVYEPLAVTETIRSHSVRTTFIQGLPFSSRLYRRYLPLMPMALERLDLRGYRLVISCESGPAKNVIVDPDALHICYCHSPMRYLWDMSAEYVAGHSAMTKAVMRGMLHYLRLADVTSAARVDGFIANSRFVARRIKKYWRRDATIVPPPVDISRFRLTPRTNGGYLWLGQLVGYKRPDIAVDAFTESGKPLTVAGEGPELRRLRARAGQNITFLGKVSDTEVAGLLEECRALVFTGTEDFGIVPVEAMACGKPVIAYRRGGVEDAVQDGITGLFFDEPTPNSLNESIRRFESRESQFSPVTIRAWAERYDEPRFRKAVQEIIDEHIRSDDEWVQGLETRP
jgi:glycosyltransferase involved in cell wall biosynthesis